MHRASYVAHCTTQAHMPSVVHHAAVSAPVQIHITLHSAPQKDSLDKAEDASRGSGVTKFHLECVSATLGLLHIRTRYGIT